MLKTLFHRATADLDNLTHVSGASATQEWIGALGRDFEGYGLLKNKNGKWDIQHAAGASNRDHVCKTVATVEDLEIATMLLRAICERDLKPHYAGLVNYLRGREYREGVGEDSMAAVERALRATSRQPAP
jgi:hypothetical protein